MKASVRGTTREALAGSETMAEGVFSLRVRPARFATSAFRRGWSPRLRPSKRHA